MSPAADPAPGFVSPDECRLLEERALAAWPALETAHLGGWLMRFADGFTKRANSACALPGAAPLEGILPDLQEHYRRRGLACCIRLTPLAPLGSAALLAARGWRFLDETLIQVAPIGPASDFDPRSDASGAVLHRESRPSAAWIDGYAEAAARPDLRRDTLARMLAAIATPASFATLVAEGEPVAYGMAVRDRGAVGLFDIATPASRRRRGHAGRLVAGLLAWAAREGDRQAYLQVTAQNAAALALYGRYGFAEAYRYVYAMPAEPG